MEISVTTKKIEHIPVLEFHDRDAQPKLPPVLIFHGFTGRKEHHTADGCELARQGYFAVAVDAFLHGELGEEPFVPTKVIPRMMEIVHETAGFIDQLTENYEQDPRVDTSRTGILGFSMGGAVIYQYLPRRKPDVKAAVSMVAGIAQYWSKTLEISRVLYPAFGVIDEMVAAARLFETWPFLEGVRDFPLLAQYGEADPLNPIQTVRDLFDQVRQGYTDPQKLCLVTYPDIGHETPPAMFARAIKWFTKYLKEPL